MEAINVQRVEPRDNDTIGSVVRCQNYSLHFVLPLFAS